MTSPAQPDIAPSSADKVVLVGVPVVIGAAVSVALGAYGRAHEPTGIALNAGPFSSPLTLKVWLASGVALFALAQLLTALVMYGKLRVVPPGRWTAPAHRWSGRVAFLLSVPVAVHCLYALGFQSYDPRVVAHSLLGCFVFGVFTVKMLLLTRRGLPGWLLPVAGGLVFTAFVGLWLTSSLWFFTDTGVKL